MLAITLSILFNKEKLISIYVQPKNEWLVYWAIINKKSLDKFSWKVLYSFTRISNV